MRDAHPEGGDDADTGAEDRDQPEDGGADRSHLHGGRVQVGEQVVEGVLQVAEDVPAGQGLELGSDLGDAGLRQAGVDVDEVGLLGQTRQVEAGLTVVQIGVDGGLAVELVELVLELALRLFREVGVGLDVAADLGDLLAELLGRGAVKLALGGDLPVDFGDLRLDLVLGCLLQGGVDLEIALDVGDLLLISAMS